MRQIFHNQTNLRSNTVFSMEPMKLSQLKPKAEHHPLPPPPQLIFLTLQSFQSSVYTMYTQQFCMSGRSELALINLFSTH